jgi:hypothetical protein
MFWSGFFAFIFSQISISPCRTDRRTIYLREEKKIGGAPSLPFYQPALCQQPVRDFCLSLLVGSYEIGSNWVTIFLEKVCNKGVIRQDQLLGMRMRLALQRDKVDEAILIPGGLHLNFYNLPALIQSRKQEHVTVRKIGRATRFLEGVPDVFHFDHGCG